MRGEGEKRSRARATAPEVMASRPPSSRCQQPSFGALFVLRLATKPPIPGASSGRMPADELWVYARSRARSRQIVGGSWSSPLSLATMEASKLARVGPLSAVLDTPWHTSGLPCGQGLRG